MLPQAETTQILRWNRKPLAEAGPVNAGEEKRGHPPKMVRRRDRRSKQGKRPTRGAREDGCVHVDVAIPLAEGLARASW